MSLDLRTLFLISSLLNATLTVYLLVVWINHRKDFKGILLFVLGMTFITLGNAGISIRDMLPPFFSIVVSNTILVGGMLLIHISLRLFFCLKTSKFLSFIFFFILLISAIEQFIYGIVMPNLMVRIISMTVLLSLPIGFTVNMLIKLRKRTSLPGYLLTISFSVQLFVFLLRIPMTLAAPVIGNFLNTSGIQAITVVIWTLVSSAWPIGFTLLISFQIQQKAQIQSREKTILLQELYHRTKNNMQVIISFLNLQKEYTKSIELKNELQKIENRIQSIVLVHKKLYQSKNLSSIPLKEYVDELVNSIFYSFDISSKEILLDSSIENISVLIDIAVPIGLILNELFSNIFRYAFPDNSGLITLEIFHMNENTIIINLKDNGVGVPEDFNFFNTGTIGMPTIIGIAENQLSGTVKFQSDNGLSCRIEFENILYNERV